MAILYPGAQWVPLPGKSTTLLDPRIINVHTMVWNLNSCQNYFAQAGNPYSHFGTGGNGECRQWQELEFRAASDYHGNPISISIENEDKGPLFPNWSGSDVPRFTGPQANTLVELIAWLCVRFAIPPWLVPDSLPGRRGPSYHRLGIDPWRVPGGILYSSAFGKVCPGDRRIAQLRDEIMPAVRARISGTSPGDDTLSAAEVEQIIKQINDKGPYFAKDDNDPAVWIVYKGNGTKRWVQTDTMWVAATSDRVWGNGVDQWGRGIPWPRSRAHLETIETVGPNPPGWGPAPPP